ncbi:MAG: SGNH/GDSL hydrolase family protein [Flavobacteriaceae bacterium]|nr:SGNH/GDSL hydrolase family protein [Flavobacteriaceae bacterium]
MKKYIKILLISSLVINLLLIGYFGYTSEIDIKNSLKNLLKSETVVKDAQLQAMNNVFIPSFEDTCNDKDGEEFKILVIGNSLSIHAIAKDIGWNYFSGMAASSIEKDYVHLLFDKIENKLEHSKLCLRISQFASFERNLASFKPESLDSLINYQPDLIIFQLGENVLLQNKKDQLLFEEKYIELINSFKKNRNPQIICTTPFFPSLLKNEIIEKVVLSTNSYLVDLSHLPLLNSENYAKDEKNYNGDKSVWKVDGIGIHPGDIGMENIAKQIFININATLSNKK